MTDAPHIDTSQIDAHQPAADALVLFGATGDLAKRKLFPSLYHLERSGTLPGSSAASGPGSKNVVSV
jgi:glucose-6-phosphate 1-dehydrogenase